MFFFQQQHGDLHGSRVFCRTILLWLLVEKLRGVFFRRFRKKPKRTLGEHARNIKKKNRQTERKKKERKKEESQSQLA